MARLCAELLLHTRCPTCETGLAINGPEEAVECHGCHRQVDVRPVLLDVLREFARDRAVQGAGCLKVLRLNGLVTRVRCVGKPPPAPSAHAPAPEWLRAQVIGVHQVWSEAPEPAPTPSTTEPVLFRCLRCGSHHEVTAASTRVSRCAYCAAELVLPGRLWERFHPSRRALPWYVGFEAEAAGPSFGRVMSHARPTDRWMPALRRWAASRPTPTGGWTSVFLGVTARVGCEHCGHPVHVNGPWRTASCPNCEQEAEVAARIGGLARDFEEEGATAEGQGCLQVSGGTEAQIWSGLAAPACSCGTSLKQPPVGFDGALSCPTCGARSACFPAPPWLGEYALDAVQCWGEREIDPANSDLTPGLGERVVTASCLGCGAALEVGADQDRVCRCSFCGRGFWVPDEVWARIHPPAPSRRWYLQFQGPVVGLPEEARQVRERGYW